MSVQKGSDGATPRMATSSQKGVRPPFPVVVPPPPSQILSVKGFFLVFSSFLLCAGAFFFLVWIHTFRRIWACRVSLLNFTAGRPCSTQRRDLGFQVEASGFGGLAVGRCWDVGVFLGVKMVLWGCCKGVMRVVQGVKTVTMSYTI